MGLFRAEGDAKQEGIFPGQCFMSRIWIRLSQIPSARSRSQQASIRIDLEEGRNPRRRERGIIVFELDHLAAIDADEVVVIGRIEEVRIVDPFIAAEIDLAQQLAFDEQGDGAVERCPRGLRVYSFSLGEEFLGREMIVTGEGGLDDNVALPGATHPLLDDVIVKTLFDFRVHRSSLS